MKTNTAHQIFYLGVYLLRLIVANTMSPQDISTDQTRSPSVTSRTPSHLIDPSEFPLFTSNNSENESNSVSTVLNLDTTLTSLNENNSTSILINGKTTFASSENLNLNKDSESATPTSRALPSQKTSPTTEIRTDSSVNIPKISSREEIARTTVTHATLSAEDLVPEDSSSSTQIILEYLELTTKTSLFIDDAESPEIQTITIQAGQSTFHSEEITTTPDSISPETVTKTSFVESSVTGSLSIHTDELFQPEPSYNDSLLTAMKEPERETEGPYTKEGITNISQSSTTIDTRQLNDSFLVSSKSIDFDEAYHLLAVQTQPPVSLDSTDTNSSLNSTLSSHKSISSTIDTDFAERTTTEIEHFEEMTLSSLTSVEVPEETSSHKPTSKDVLLFHSEGSSTIDGIPFNEPMIANGSFMTYEESTEETFSMTSDDPLSKNQTFFVTSEETPTSKDTLFITQEPSLTKDSFFIEIIGSSSPRTEVSPTQNAAASGITHLTELLENTNGTGMQVIAKPISDRTFSQSDSTLVPSAVNFSAETTEDEINITEDLTESTAVSTVVSIGETQEVPYSSFPKEYNYDTLSTDVKIGITTIVFYAPGLEISEWIQYEEFRFRTVVVELLEKLLDVATEEMKNSTSNDPVANARVYSKPFSADDVVYVRPTPRTDGSRLIISFLVENKTADGRNGSVHGEVIVNAVARGKETLEQKVWMNLTSLYRGIYATFVDPNTLSTQASFLVRHLEVIIITVVILVFCLVILFAGVWLKCRTRGVSMYESDKAVLEKDMHSTVESGDLNPENQILSEEMKEQDSKALINGKNKIPVGLDDEGWVVPFKEIPLEDKNEPDVQDTKL
ncbi:uncharacterized protein LOC111085952 [Limulus polyphemus]|uniref:Uncharacterized protein LOC111085952 n=1 Tax=Limulus polyphemus TaxID=6850 RepID=A0ABM1SG83_LIMPO|nr:uncharacterized protein LOC111085952 [Limulus polyphemus]